ncbi:MAG: cob(I)yrinic acid a,c-diamide adenosyltransferase [Bacteroides sp.]
MKSNVYTRTGDAGQTSLIGGTRVSKTDLRLEAYGTVDELNAQLGLLLTYFIEPVADEFVAAAHAEDAALLLRVQRCLFTVGAALATDTSKLPPRPTAIVTPEMVSELEQAIDRIDSQLPPLRLFILPGGGRAAAVAHVCRTICRRAERRILALAEQADVPPELLAYVNRLSDYLFVLSRKLNVDEKIEEIIWNKRNK